MVHTACYSDNSLNRKRRAREGSQGRGRCEIDRLEEDFKKQHTGGAEGSMAGRAPGGTARGFLAMRKSRRSQERSRK